MWSQMNEPGMGAPWGAIHFRFQDGKMKQMQFDPPVKYPTEEAKRKADHNQNSTVIPLEGELPNGCMKFLPLTVITEKEVEYSMKHGRQALLELLYTKDKKDTFSSWTESLLSRF